jgi:CobQ-like glutamine amidotransferase family enzyme
MKMKMGLGYLYPSVMSQYGDRGNVLTIVKRCQWRGIDVEVTELEVGDHLEPDDVDLFLVGGGADSQQRVICDDLLQVKGDAIRKAVDDGAAAFAVCAGYQLWGHFYRTASGEELPGLGIFDAHTVHRAAQTGTKLDTITKAGSVRSVGNLLVEWDNQVLVGFENHGGRTYLSANSQPLGKTLSGGGNNSEDGWEGCVYKNAVGTYLHGPALPKNPALADHLIQAALTRKYGMLSLEPLPDVKESVAHDRALEQVTAAKKRRRWLKSSGVG